MTDSGINRSDLIHLVLRLTLVTAASFFGVKWLMSYVDPTSSTKRAAKKKAQEHLKRLTETESNNSNALLQKDLTDYEMMVLAHLIHPEDIDVTWENIAGMDLLIQELRETVILPIQHRALFADSQLTSPPKGVLLHGPPGCGKTLIAKATAKAAATRFINLDVSILTDKWYGESQKITAAVFTLAVKLQPCIIFIDEIDSFLRVRHSNDHEATAMMKAQFMSLWDGFCTNATANTVIVMGATNRPQDLDKAILRRMPAVFHVPLPAEVQRKHILELTLRTERKADDIDVAALAASTNNFSGSDLHELCRNASIYRVRDYMRENPELASGDASVQQLHRGGSFRAICQNDLLMSLERMRQAKMQCNTGISLASRIDID